MKIIFIVFLSILLVLASICFVSAQNADTIVFSKISEYKYSWYYSSYSSQFDRTGKPYIYAASNELGLIIFNITDINNPVPIDTFTTQQFGGLKVNNLAQRAGYLYITLGGFQGATQRAGLAILDITNPANAVITDSWDSAYFNKGSTVVAVDNNHAFLGVMDSGLVILNVSDIHNIKYISKIVPDFNFPVPPGLFSKPHARGLAVKGNYVFVCEDAGGLRTIDVSDKYHPVEVEKYMGHKLDSVAQPAYNNVAIAGNRAYIAVDYCGLEVVDISNPLDIKPVEWDNLWSCNNTNWNGRAGHANQLLTTNHDSMLFVSGGDSEILAFDITDPQHIRLLGQYAHVHDSIASWGMDVYNNHAVISLVNNSLLQQPYISTYGGIQILNWQLLPTSIVDINDKALLLYPNPNQGEIALKVRLSEDQLLLFTIYDMLGNTLISQQQQGLHGVEEYHFSFSQLPAGIYFVHVGAKATGFYCKMVKN